MSQTRPGPDSGAKEMTIPLADFFRATLAEETGNVGYIGLAPDGSKHHVVVPVDIQIARGIKAGNRPTDGTPFGGYAGWRYFECRPYPSPQPDQDAERRARWAQAEKNAAVFVAWAAGHSIRVVVVGEAAA